MPIRVTQRDLWASSLASQWIRPGVARGVAPRSAPAPPPHELVLYDFEASPWCRLVREQATVLDLALVIRPCPRETLLFGEGSFGPRSGFRPEAMEWHQKRYRNDELTFPLLVDRTRSAPSDGQNGDSHHETAETIVVLRESYEIVSHLWEHYGASVLPTPQGQPRPDQVAHDPSRSFARRFFSLAGPSYLRPWPRCGLLRLPSLAPPPNNQRLVLYQAEGCPESRLVREALCGLELSYRSVPGLAKGSSHALPPEVEQASPDDGATGSGKRPVLQVFTDTGGAAGAASHCVAGAAECVEYLRENYADCDAPAPTWFEPRPADNRGRSGGPNFSVATAAWSALRRGGAHRALVPDRALA